MKNEKMKEVFAEKAFIKSLAEMNTVAEMQEALNAKGIQLDEKEIVGIRSLFDKVKNGEISRAQLEKWGKLAENGELAEDLLEMVAGGIEPFTLISIFAATVVIGTGLFGLFDFN